MAKMLKHLVFGQKKNPPAPPRPDYKGDKVEDIHLANQSNAQFFNHDYENLPKHNAKVQFVEKKEPELVVFDNYSQPADLLAELSALEADPLYMSPLDDQGSAPPPPEDEEEMYCVPYDSPEDENAAPPVPNPCLLKGHSVNETEPEDAYDVVPDVSDNDDDDARPIDEYDEPWEWTVGARLTSSLQVSPTLSLDDRILSDDEDEMTARQRRLYETAFDSRVRRDADDLDRLMQSPLFLNRTGETVARAASRSSFGSTSGSSASSTPTHQPMEIARQSPRHFTPTERRKVTLVRDALPRSMSPQARPKPDLLKGVINQNYERKISFINQWDNVSRGSSSEKSSSQESMNVELSSKNERNCVLVKSSSRDSLEERSRNLTSNYPNNWKELTSAKLVDNSNEVLQKDNVLHKDDKNDSSIITKKLVSGHTGVKVLPTDNSNNSPRFSRLKHTNRPNEPTPTQDPELKENQGQADPPASRKPSRPSSLLSEVRPMDNVPQSPENDNRSSEDYDPPWDLKTGKGVLRPSGVNGSVSVPERLSSAQTHITTSITCDKLEVDETKERTGKPNRPNGPPSRPNLNLNLNSDSPRKARQNLTLNFGCAALNAVGEKVDPQLILEKQGWYHGSISRVDAEGKLRVLKEGSYLVRNSESSKHDYSLSLRSARGFMHMKIVPTSEGRFILGQFSNPFSSIPEMIQHYSVNKLPIKGAEHMSLLYPVIDQLL